MILKDGTIQQIMNDLWHGKEVILPAMTLEIPDAPMNEEEYPQVVNGGTVISGSQAYAQLAQGIANTYGYPNAYENEPELPADSDKPVEDKQAEIDRMWEAHKSLGSH